MPEESISPNDVSALRKSRQLKILEKYARGDRVSTEQMQEIAPLIAAPPPSPSPVLDPPPKLRSGYSQPLAEYQQTYGRKLRQLKNWIAAGKNPPPGTAPQLPPLDDPAAMLTWWPLYMRQRIPECVMRAASQSADVTGNFFNPSSEKTEAGAPPRGMLPMGLPEAVESMKRTVATLFTDYDRAVNDPTAEESTLSLRSKRFHEALDSLRAAEQTLEGFRKGRGELISIDEVRADWGNLLATLRNWRERMPAEVTERLAALELAPAALATIAAAIAAVRADEDRLLVAAKYWPESAPPPSAHA